jgi:hypothetical protein
MTETVLLQAFVTTHREAIIQRCRATVAARSLPPATKVETDHGVPMFLDQMAEQLGLRLSHNPTIADTASQHGRDLRTQGFTISQVVHSYGDVCQAITGLAVEEHASLNAEDFRSLNGCLDDAIAAAVTEYSSERDQSLDEHIEDERDRLKVLAHELRNAIHTAGVAMEVVKSGRVGIAGSTGTVLDRSLLTAHTLADRLLAEVDASRALRT